MELRFWLNLFYYLFNCARHNTSKKNQSYNSLNFKENIPTEISMSKPSI